MDKCTTLNCLQRKVDALFAYLLFSLLPHCYLFTQLDALHYTVL